MIGSKLGVHVVIGSRNGYGDFLARLGDAGKTVLVKCVDDFGAAWGAKNEYPGLKSLTVGRVNGVRGPLTGEWIDLQGLDGVAGSVSPETGARWYFDLVLPKWKLNPHIDVWETCNEWSSWWSWQAEFYIEMMKLASGYKLALWACSTGNPPELGWPAISRAAQYAKAHGHYISMHEYGGVDDNPYTLRGTEPYHALRYRALYDYLKAQNADAPLIISECGQNAGYQFAGVDAFIEDFAWYDSELAKDSYVVGAAAWTLGNWHEANIQDALPALAEYMVNASYPDPGTPPQPPPEREPYPYGRVIHLIPQDTAEAEYDVVRAAARERKEGIVYSANDAFITHPDLTGRRVTVWAVSRWGGQAALEAWVMKHYPPLPEIVYREFSSSPPPPIQPLKLVSPVPSIPLVVTDPFNAPRDYANGLHEGVDIRAVDAAGNPVPIVACADGVVETDMDVVSGGYGKAVVLRHDWPDGNTYRTWYAHLAENYVSAGQQVKAGDVIGLAGTTGNSTGIHLHLNLQWVGHGLAGYAVPDVVDPAPYLPLSTPPPTPPPSDARALVGLHLRTNGLDHNAPEFAGELDLIRRARIQAVKFTSNSTFESLSALLAAGIPPENVVIRPYMAGNDLNLRNPDTFWYYLRAWVKFAVSRGVLRFEIHNEPNLSLEGLGSAWPDAAGFAWWYEKVRAAIKAEFPSALVGFPGLSPQPNVADWLSACAGVIGKSDWIGAHAYWQTEDQMTQAEHGAYWQRYMQFGKPIYITEFANVSSTPKHEKGLQYVSYYDMLRAPVVAAFSFVSSAPGGDFPEQTWAGSDIADTVGARQW